MSLGLCGLSSMTRKGLGVRQLTISITILLVSALSWAQDIQPAILNFKAWKDQQVLTAQNQMLRISARIAQVKSGKGAKADKKDLALTSKSIKKTEVDPMEEAERELRRAQDSLEAASNWTMEDYVNVYIPTLKNQPDALQKLTEKLSKEELADILKVMLVRTPPSTTPIDAKQSGAIIGGLNRPTNVETR